MKSCDYCGRQNEAGAVWCYECGSSLVEPAPEPDPVEAQRALIPEDIPFTRRQGNHIVLRCRTPREAILVAELLEEVEIVPVLPSPEAMRQEYKQHGCVEVLVSARAYECDTELRAVVEFHYERLRRQKPLPALAKAVGMGCGAFFLPGLLIFAWVLTGYQSGGYKRMAKEFKLWFGFGVAAWVLIIVFCMLVLD